MSTFRLSIKLVGCSNTFMQFTGDKVAAPRISLVLNEGRTQLFVYDDDGPE